MRMPDKLATSQMRTLGLSKEQARAQLGAEAELAYSQAFNSRVRADSARVLAVNNTGNFFPNSTSETVPPVGADLNSPEWAGRVNAGAGAYSGNWVREVSAPHSG